MASATQRTLNILLVEDNSMNRKIAGRMISGLGHSVTFAENGAIAVELCSANTFDMIFMDIQMPVMDGVQATKEIRKSEENNNMRIPIIALIANVLPADCQNYCDAGIDMVISKPVRIQDLSNAIIQYLSISPYYLKKS